MISSDKSSTFIIISSPCIPRTLSLWEWDSPLQFGVLALVGPCTVQKCLLDWWYLSCLSTQPGKTKLISSGYDLYTSLPHPRRWMGVSCTVCTSLLESKAVVFGLVAVGASESAEPEFESLMQHCMTWTQFFFIRWLFSLFLWVFLGPQMYKLGFPDGTRGKELTCQCSRNRDAGSVSGSERSPGGGHGNPLWYSCLKNLLDRGDWQASVHEVNKSQTWLSDLVCTDLSELDY